jgi:hypothetical protein
LSSSTAPTWRAAPCLCASTSTPERAGQLLSS